MLISVFNIFGYIFDYTLNIPRLSLIVVISILTAIYFSNNEKKRFAKLFPGPKTIPILGNSLEFIIGGDVVRKKILHFMETYGNEPFRLWAGSELFIAISDPEDIKIISHNSLTKTEAFNVFHDIYGESLFTALEVDKMKQRRKKMVGLFNINRLIQFTKVMEEKAKIAVESVQKYVEAKEMVNPWEAIALSSFRINTNVIMDIEFDEPDKEKSRSGNINLNAIAISDMRLWFSSKFIDSLFFKRKVKQLSKGALDFVKHIIEERAKKKEANKLSGFSNEGNGYFDTLCQIVTAENNMQVLYNELFLAMITGPDVIATLTTFSLLMFGIHQDVQDKVYNELNEIFGDNTDREITLEDLKQMTYMQQVIQESLRLISAVPYIYRCTDRELKIRSHTLPARTNVILLFYGLHHNPKYYPEPFKFNPDNFSPEAIASRPKNTLLAFSIGSRRCIGRTYTMVETKILLAKFMMKYKFSADTKMEDIKFAGSLIQAPVGNDYRLFLEERNC